MFKRRLIALLVLLGLALGVTVFRLAQVQLAYGSYYADLAAESLLRPVQFLSPVRGAIWSR